MVRRDLLENGWKELLRNETAKTAVSVLVDLQPPVKKSITAAGLDARKKTMKLYIDGGCTNNQREPKDRQMRIVVADETGIPVVEKPLPGGSNNIAELWAVAEALLFAKRAGIAEIELYTDSRNALAWLEGRIGKRLNDRAAVMNLLDTINKLRRRITMVATWIPRGENLAGQYIKQTATASK